MHKENKEELVCAAHLLREQSDLSGSFHPSDYVTRGCEHTQRQLSYVNPPSSGTSLSSLCSPLAWLAPRRRRIPRRLPETTRPAVES